MTEPVVIGNATLTGMIAHTIAHLFPSTDAVAVSAKQTQVAFVGGPVFESVAPCTSLGSDLLSGVYVVDVQDAMVSNAATCAFPPKGFDHGRLPSPISRVLMHLESMLVPVVFAALVGAKAVLALLAATFALGGPLPSADEVAGSATEFPCSIFQPIHMGLKLGGTIRADGLNAGFFHSSIIPRFIEPKYFDIACRRIEDAQRQGRMFA